MPNGFKLINNIVFKQRSSESLLFSGESLIRYGLVQKQIFLHSPGQGGPETPSGLALLIF